MILWVSWAGTVHIYTYIRVVEAFHELHVVFMGCRKMTGRF